MKEILQDGYGYVGAFLRSFDEVAAVFYSGEEQKVRIMLRQLTEGFQWMFQVLGDNGLVDIQDELRILDDMLPAMETYMKEREYVALGDLFQYEIYFVLLRIHEKIEQRLIDETI